VALSSIYQHKIRHDEPFAVLLGSRIRDLRLRAGLTQTELGSPRTRSFISAVEHGRTLPSLRALLQMAERLEVPVAALLDELEWTGEDIYTWLHASHDSPPSNRR
jgi:transcriptional regulator with XRE-family HTH domain